MSITKTSTPTLIMHNLSDLDLSDIETCHLYISNISNRNTQVYVPNINVGENTISYEMSQEESALFNPGIIEVQLKFKLNSGKCLHSKIMKTNVARIIEGEIL